MTKDQDKWPETPDNLLQRKANEFMDDKIEYYLYHIPGKKIGVTRNLISRVVDQQGYNLDEIEVLDQSSTDIDYISERELELQQSYGYRVDRQKYKDLYINKIIIKYNENKRNRTNINISSSIKQIKRKING